MALTNDDILVVQSSADKGLYKVSVKDLNAGALTLISETAPDTDAYEEGTLWFNSAETEANLYVLYADEDPAAGKKWVQTSGTGGGSGGDGGIPTLIADGTDGAPDPNSYDAGTLWYNSAATDGSLYILYVDEAPDAGKKWVEIASGSGGSSGGDGGGGDFSGDYNDLTNKPDIPENTSDLVNDSGFITAADIPPAEDVGAADVSYTYPDPEAVEQTVQERLEQYVSVKDFGAKGDGTTDDTDAIQAALDAAEGNVLFFPKGQYIIEKTLITKPGTRLLGANKSIEWEQAWDTAGSVIRTRGLGNPQIWTDIADGDDDPITPCIVAGGDSVYFENLSFVTTGSSTRWSCAMFFPAVKTCGYRNVHARGFSDCCVYLDATWSNVNRVS